MERMTDDERRKIEDFVEAGHLLSQDQASALLYEADRARASETTHAQQLQAKDAEISGLKIDLSEAHEDRDNWHRKADALQEEAATLKADNAAMLERGNRLHALSPHDEACRSLVDSAACDCTLSEWADAAHQPHPGAALLEEHKRALVRARSEGLEKARKMVHNVGFHNLASLIDAAMEPEQ
jgi:hypothetical protein